MTPGESFARLHDEGTFVMPNVWDLGSLNIVVSLGFAAVATTSSGFAASMGRMDQQTTLEELEKHVAALTSESPVPVSVDAENGYSATSQGVASTVERLATVGAAGVSIEDFSPDSGIYPIDVATERVAAAAEVAHRHDLVLTARAENHLYDRADLEDTINRLLAYQQAGADVLYAPGLDDIDELRTLVEAVAAPINVLLRRGGPTVAQLGEIGVRRISTGGALSFAAYGALAEAARELLESGTTDFMDRLISEEDRRRAFRRGE